MQISEYNFMFCNIKMQKMMIDDKNCLSISTEPQFPDVHIMKFANIEMVAYPQVFEHIFVQMEPLPSRRRSIAR